MPTRYTPNETTRNMIDRVLQSLKSARWNVGVTMNIDYIHEQLSRNEENYMNEVSQLKNIPAPGVAPISCLFLLHVSSKSCKHHEREQTTESCNARGVRAGVVCWWLSSLEEE